MNIIAYVIKDLKTQKFRTLLGIFGISLSIFLLTTVSFLTDTVTTSYVDFLTVDSGNVDFDIFTRYVEGGQQQLPFLFNYTDMTNKIKNSSVATELDAYLPRYIDTSYTVNVSNTNVLEYIDFIGLNVSLEKESGFGKIISPEYDFETYGIPYGNCAISENLANKLNLKIGDTLNISRERYDNGTTKPDKWLNLTVCAIFSYNLKFPSSFNKLVLVDIGDLPYLFGSLSNPNENYTEVANHLYITLKEPELKYNIRNAEQSINDIIDIGGEIQLAIGYGYWVYMPKLVYFEYSQYFNMFIGIVFVFIGLISMLISGILITGILSTSVEERIREFGIFRCLGAYKSFNLKLVILTGLVICISGTILGIFNAYIFVKNILINGVNRALSVGLISTGYYSGQLRFVAQPISIITSLVIGVTISMIVSLSPAIKVMRIPIVQSINPYRREQVVYKLVRESRVNVKLISFGSLLAANGAIIFFIIPRLFISMNITALSTTFTIVLLVFLIGLTMAGIGLMPLLLRLWLNVLRPFGRKFYNIIRVNVFRHERRNNTTILMFCLSFSFVIFTSSMISIMLTQVSALEEFEEGSPLVLYRRWGSELEYPTVELQQELMEIEGIERTSAVIASPHQLSTIYSDEAKSFDAEIGDYIYFKSSDARIYGIDQNYLDTVYSNYMHFKQGNIEQAFNNLFNGNNTCIVSAALCRDLELDLGDQVRLTFIRGEEQIIEIFTIVGIADKMPGFYRFKESTFSGYANGVLISADKYIEYMGIPNPAWIYKIFIDLREDYNNLDKSIEVENNIYTNLSDDWSFWVNNVIEDIEETSNVFFWVEIGLQAILSFTVIICMFGLFISSYSSILERKREIGILRALGIRKKGVSKLFIIESIIILLASGSTGALVGYFTAILLSENMTLFIESPRLLSVPWFSLFILFGVTTMVLYLGMKLLLKKVKRQNLIEIFRETM
ncbi:MAG: ABC transporter permease [Promethearchaeota archaeon]